MERSPVPLAHSLPPRAALDPTKPAAVPDPQEAPRGTGAPRQVLTQVYAR